MTSSGEDVVMSEFCLLSSFQSKRYLKTSSCIFVLKVLSQSNERVRVWVKICASRTKDSALLFASCYTVLKMRAQIETRCIPTVTELQLSKLSGFVSLSQSSHCLFRSVALNTGLGSITGDADRNCSCIGFYPPECRAVWERSCRLSYGVYFLALFQTAWGRLCSLGDKNSKGQVWRFMPVTLVFWDTGSGVQGHLWLHSKFEVNVGYMGTCLKNLGGRAKLNISVISIRIKYICITKLNINHGSCWHLLAKLCLGKRACSHI